MKSIDLDTIKAAWKNEKSFEDQRLSEADIENFLGRKSRDISRLFRKGLLFDIVMKSVIGLSLLGILFLFRGNQSILLMISVVLLFTTWTIFYQWRKIGRIPESGGPDPVIRTSLENKVNYYYQHYIKSIYVGALSNSLFVLSGMLYYFYFKYGEIRPFQWDDYLVFALVLLLSFVIGAVAQVKQHNFQVKQLESCLQEIDEESISALTIRDQRNKKRRMTLLFVLALLCGLVLLAFLIFN